MSTGFLSHITVIAFGRYSFLSWSTAYSPRLGSAAQLCESIGSSLFFLSFHSVQRFVALPPVAGSWEYSVTLCMFPCVPRRIKSSACWECECLDRHTVVCLSFSFSVLMVLIGSIHWQNRCLFPLLWHGRKRLPIISIYISFWLYQHDQHALYLSDLSATSLPL